MSVCVCLCVRVYSVLPHLLLLLLTQWCWENALQREAIKEQRTTCLMCTQTSCAVKTSRRSASGESRSVWNRASSHSCACEI